VFLAPHQCWLYQMRHMYSEYEEVLSHQSEHIQAFLMLTSILERLNASLCDAVSGQTGSQAILERLEKADLFLVAMDGVRYWYRYHAMFADVLQFRLHQAQSDLVPILHRRAAEWYEDHGYADEAIAHRLQAEQIDLAIQSGDQSWMHMMRHRAIIKLMPARSDVIDTPLSSARVNDLEWVVAAPHVREQGLLLMPAVPLAQQHQLGEAPSQVLSVPAHKDVVEQLAEPLTERELAILHLMAQGLTYAEVSQQLVISVNTVRFHVMNMYSKLNVHGGVPNEEYSRAITESY